MNGVLGLTDDPFPRPEIVNDYMEDLNNFALGCSNIVHVILGVLSDSLDLANGEKFESYHRSSFPSPSIVRLLKYAAGPPGSPGADVAPSVPHTPHTDLGTITLLFADSPGLQILPDGTDTWLDIEPKPGLIVNFGDALSLLTGGYFRSVLHRVASRQGKRMGERYSIAYMQRPEDHTPMRPLPSPLLANTSPVRSEKVEAESLTCAQWIDRKFGALRGNFDVNNDQSVVSGGRLFVPGWKSQAV